jgi:hypothetical protein
MLNLMLVLRRLASCCAMAGVITDPFEMKLIGVPLASPARNIGSSSLLRSGSPMP